MDNMKSNTGLIFEPLKIGQDFVFGSSHSILTNFKSDIVLQSDGDWRYLAPEGEIQHHTEMRFDTQGCVSHGTLNALELLQRRVHGQTINYSDRFVVKGSGTDPSRGNSPQKVADFIRHNWSVFEPEWPREGVQTLQEYYADLPQGLVALAKKRLGSFKFGYEFVNPGSGNLKEALKYSPICMSVGLSGVDKDGFWYRNEGVPDGHWLTLLHIDEDGVYTILDSYKPYIKRLRNDFESKFAYRYYLDIEQMTLMTRLISLLKDIIYKLQYGIT